MSNAQLLLLIGSIFFAIPCERDELATVHATVGIVCFVVAAIIHFFM